MINNFDIAAKQYSLPKNIITWVYEQSAEHAIDLNSINYKKSDHIESIKVGEQRAGNFIIVIIDPFPSAARYKKSGFRFDIEEMIGDTIYD